MIMASVFLFHIIVLLYKLASILFSSKIISVGVRNVIFRSGFLGTVVQLTHVLGNDVIEALTSDVLVTIQQAHVTIFYSRNSFIDMST